MRRQAKEKATEKMEKMTKRTKTKKMLVVSKTGPRNRRRGRYSHRVRATSKWSDALKRCVLKRLPLSGFLPSWMTLPLDYLDLVSVEHLARYGRDSVIKKILKHPEEQQQNCEG
jgi:hypothetical protein